jgi:hypothetical protein
MVGWMIGTRNAVDDALTFFLVRTADCGTVLVLLSDNINTL